MSDRIQFETPENIQISYQQAGLGTRFLAWFVDFVLMLLVGFVLFLLLIIGGMIAEVTARSLLESLEGVGAPNDEDSTMVFMWLAGIFVLLFGLGSMFYFGLSELMMRGQTIGKRMMHIRVVKTDGFALDGVSILVRNIFRTIDQIPALWIVPLVSARAQRFGDLVAGTLVVKDRVDELAGVREILSRRRAADARFRFDVSRLKKLTHRDFESIEKILERWPHVTLEKRNELLDTIIPTLTRRLDVEAPDWDSRQEFLQDLLAAEYRRQNRELG
ncbi:MAG: RDD family protein [Planctomycetota bacterium]|jgi:uncharacterized RDD family membrane protein YckC